MICKVNFWINTSLVFIWVCTTTLCKIAFLKSHQWHLILNLSSHTAWTWPHLRNPRSVISSWVWRFQLLPSNVNKSRRSRSRPRISHSSPPRPPKPQTFTGMRLSCPPPVITSDPLSRPRQSGVSAPFPLPTFTCVLIIFTCRPTISKRRDSRTSCRRMFSKSSSSFLISERRFVFIKLIVLNFKWKWTWGGPKKTCMLLNCYGILKCDTFEFWLSLKDKKLFISTKQVNCYTKCYIYIPFLKGKHFLFRLVKILICNMKSLTKIIPGEICLDKMTELKRDITSNNFLSLDCRLYVRSKSSRQSTSEGDPMYCAGTSMGYSPNCSPPITTPSTRVPKGQSVHTSLS